MNKSIKTKTVIVYHKYPYGYCPDGIASAWILSRYLKEKETTPIFIGKNYQDLNNPDPNFTKEILKHGGILSSTLYCLDFAGFTSLQWFQLLRDFRKVYVFDHHQDKFQKVRNSGIPKHHLSLDEKKCGARLTWEYCFLDLPLPKWLKHIEMRDIGLRGYYDGLQYRSECINTGLSKIRKEFDDPFKFFDQLLDCPQYWDEGKFLKIGKPEIDKRDELIKILIEDWEANPQYLEISHQPQRILPLLDLRSQKYKFLHSHYSMVGTIVARRMNWECASILLRSPINEEDYQINLRAPSEKPPCLPIATELGGGGHTHACGFPLKSIQIVKKPSK